MGDGAGSGKSHSTTPIPKFDVSIEKEAPSGVKSIKKFIEQVEHFEKNHKKSQPDDTKYMISLLRKVFYGEDSWDKHLIPGAKSIEKPYNIEIIKEGSYTLSVPWEPDTVEVERKKYKVKNSKGKVPGIFKRREIKDKNGKRKSVKGQEVRLKSDLFCDIGHVFAGLDAFNHKHKVIAPRIRNINIPSNVDAVTWVGDIGSALAEMTFKRYHPNRSKSGPLSIEECNEVIAEYASPQDMLGNIDAYAIYSAFPLKGQNAPRVSQILGEYYLKDNPARKHRYSRFAGNVDAWGGAALDWRPAWGFFSNRKDWVSNKIDVVNDSAAMYVYVNTNALYYPGEKIGFIISMSGNQDAKPLLNAFLDALEVNIRQEE